MTLGKPLGSEPHFCHKYNWTHLQTELFDDFAKHVDHDIPLRQILRTSLIVPHQVHMETFL